MIIDPTFCGSRFSTGRLLAIEDFFYSDREKARDTETERESERHRDREKEGDTETERKEETERQ